MRPNFCGTSLLPFFYNLIKSHPYTLVRFNPPGASLRPIIRKQSPNTFYSIVRHPEFSIICIGSESCLWSIVGLPGSYACYLTVGVLGTGVPRLACLRPTAWLHQRPRTAHLHQQTLKTLARGQASRGGRRKTSSGAASPGSLARGGEIKARGTSRGSRDASHDDHDQASARRAPARTVSSFPLWW